MKKPRVFITGSRRISCTATKMEFKLIVAALEDYNGIKLVRRMHNADYILYLSGCCGTVDHLNTELQYVKILLSMRRKKGAKIILTGCMAREFTKSNTILSEVDKLKKQIDYVIPLANRDEIFKLFGQKIEDNIADCMQRKELPSLASIWVGDGCLNRCSFCKINYTKWPLKSRKLEEVFATIDLCAEHGISAVSIGAPNLAQYGLDLYSEPRLMDILKYVEAKDEIHLLDLTGLAISDSVRYGFAKELNKLSKLLKIEIALESGSNRLLKLMRKGFTVEQFKTFVAELRNGRESKENRIFLAFNIIAGFPTETEDDIKATCDLIRDVGYCRVLNVSAYHSPGVKGSSADLPEFSKDEVNAHIASYEKYLTEYGIKYAVE